MHAPSPSRSALWVLCKYYGDTAAQATVNVLCEGKGGPMDTKHNWVCLHAPMWLGCRCVPPYQVVFQQ